MVRGRLADTVVGELATEIIMGRWRPEGLLPTEHQLGERFGVSRTVVREALARLARAGLVRVRHGAGSVVLDRGEWDELDPELLQIRAARGLIGDLVRDLLGIRRMVEVEVAGQAALLREDAELARMAELLDLMRANLGTPEAYIDADIAFHDSLIVASGNQLLRRIMRPVNQVRRIGSVISLLATSNVLGPSMAGHDDIFAAVVRRDTAGARDAMSAHIAHFEVILLEGLTAAGRQAGGDGLGSNPSWLTHGAVVHSQDAVPVGQMAAAIAGN